MEEDIITYILFAMCHRVKAANKKLNMLVTRVCHQNMQYDKT